MNAPKLAPKESDDHAEPSEQKQAVDGVVDGDRAQPLETRIQNLKKTVYGFLKQYTPYLRLSDAGRRELPRWVVLAASGLAGLFVISGRGTRLLCSLAGFIYPLYQSLRALRTPGKDDDTQWLTYWVVFGFFEMLEPYARVVLQWFPFYYIFKLAFLMWCCWPLRKYSGAELIYQRVMLPLVQQYEVNIDTAAHWLSRGAKEAAAVAADSVQSVIASASDQAANAIANEAKSAMAVRLVPAGDEVVAQSAMAPQAEQAEAPQQPQQQPETPPQDNDASGETPYR